MSLLARMLIIAQAMLVMVYLGVTATLFQHSRDWRDSYQKLKQRYHDVAVRATKEIKTVRETVKQREKFIDLKNTEIGDLKKEKERADADYQAKNTALSRKTTEYGRLLDVNNRLTTDYDNRSNSIRSLRQDIKRKQEDLNLNIRRRGVAEQHVARLTTDTLNLDTDIEDLRKEHTTVHRKLRKKQMLIAMAEERGVNFAELLAGPPAKLVKGRVSAVKTDLDHPLVVIDVGSDDEVLIGYPMSIYRGNLFVGKVIVERVESTASACRVLYTAEGQSIQPGDDVTTRLP